MPILTQKNDIFKAVGEIPAIDVFKAFHGGEVRKNKASCPFHSENSPSFHIYEHSFYCFGCGWGGDNVAFVAKLLNSRPLEAAKAIADHFGIFYDDSPLSQVDRQRLARARARREQEKKIISALNTWCRKRGITARVLAEAIRDALPDTGPNTPLLDMLPTFEYWADVLFTGNDEERLQAFRDSDLRRWLK